MKNRNINFRTRNNWILDAFLFLTALVTILSGVYFLIFPDGGYKGGRNPYYGIQIIFEREGWEWMHTWIGLGMIVIALAHLTIHYKWVISMFKNIVNSIREKKLPLNRASRWNLLLITIVALSFVLSLISGVYFLLTPDSQGGRNPDPMILFSRTAWDNLHTISSIVFICAALLHIVLHWGWIRKVTAKLFTRKNLVTPSGVLLETN